MSAPSGNSDWRPSARLRWVTVPTALGEGTGSRLEQWWGPELPGYMRDDRVGEWRAIPTVEAAP